MSRKGAAQNRANRTETAPVLDMVKWLVTIDGGLFDLFGRLVRPFRKRGKL
jgi:hypothetical protein